MSTVKVSDLGKDYAGVPALADVSIVFAQGAVTAIIGRSGSGKIFGLMNRDLQVDILLTCQLHQCYRTTGPGRSATDDPDLEA